MGRRFLLHAVKKKEQEERGVTWRTACSDFGRQVNGKTAAAAEFSWTCGGCCCCSPEEGWTGCLDGFAQVWRTRETGWGLAGFEYGERGGEGEDETAIDTTGFLRASKLAYIECLTLLLKKNLNSIGWRRGCTLGWLKTEISLHQSIWHCLCLQKFCERQVKGKFKMADEKS